MYWTQFYTPSATSGEPIEACGDRAVIILDGRETMAKMHGFSIVECCKRNYIGYRLYKGETLNRDYNAISDYKPVSDPEVCHKCNMHLAEELSGLCKHCDDDNE